MGMGQYWTIGSRLPEGATIQEQLQNWINNQEEIENLALPTGDKEVVPLWVTIRNSLKIRGQLTKGTEHKLKALEHHALNGGYCQYLKSNGRLKSCDAPKIRGNGPLPP